MPYAVLRIIEGSEPGREIVLAERPYEAGFGIGSDEQDEIRILTPGVVAQHGGVSWGEAEQFYVVAGEGPVAIDGEVVDFREGVPPGSTVAFGPCSFVLEVRDGLRPDEQAYVEALERSAAGGQPYRWAVQFQPDGGEKAGAILEAGAGALRLIGLDLRSIFAVPLAEVAEASYPRTKGSLIELRADGAKYKIWLLEPYWGETTSVDFENTGTGELVDPFGGAGGPETGTARDIGYAINIAFDVLSSVGSRVERNQWRRVLEGEDVAEEVSQQLATQLLE